VEFPVNSNLKNKSWSVRQVEDKINITRDEKNHVVIMIYSYNLLNWYRLNILHAKASTRYWYIPD
jgi:hypothetical protein